MLATLHGIVPPTAADDDDNQLLEELEDLWWWLFVSPGANACFAFLEDHDQCLAQCKEDKEDEDEDEREEVFLALAPAVLDRLQRAACRELLDALRTRTKDAMPLVWRRVKQACSRGGAQQPTRAEEEESHGAQSHGCRDKAKDEYRRAELVRTLLGCLTAGGVACWETTDFFEVVLQHSNVAVVLEGIDYIMDNENDPDLLAKLSKHPDERVREAVISGLLPATLPDFQDVVRTLGEDPSEAVQRVIYQFMAESIHVFEVDVEDVETVPLLMETILSVLEHGDVSLAAAATHLLTTLIETQFEVDEENTSKLKLIDKLLSEGCPRLAGLLVDNLLRRAPPERLLVIATRSVMAHYDLCQPHLSALPRELQATITRQKHQGERQARAARRARRQGIQLIGEGQDEPLHERTMACVSKLLVQDEESDEVNKVWRKMFSDTGQHAPDV